MDLDQTNTKHKFQEYSLFSYEMFVSTVPSLNFVTEAKCYRILVQKNK